MSDQYIVMDKESVGNHFIIFSGTVEHSADHAGLNALMNLSPLMEDDHEFSRFLHSYYYRSFVELYFEQSVRSDKLFQVRKISREVPEGEYQINGLEFSINAIDLCLFPGGLCLYSITIGSVQPIDGTGTTVTDISTFIKSFRTFSSLLIGPEGKETVQEFIDRTILCINKENSLFEANSNAYLNNKLKSFTVVEIDTSGIERDQVLLNLGTVITENQNSHTEEFNKLTLESSTLEIYKDWKALFLYDTFTLLVADIENHKDPHGVYHSAKNLYFPIYLNVLYMKSYLFHVNGILYQDQLKHNRNRSIRDTFFEITNKFNFTHVSYNVLPNLFLSKFRESLELQTEMDSLEQKVEKMNLLINERQGRRTNRVLTLLSIFSAGTAVYATADWAMIAFNLGRTHYGFISLGILCCISLPIILISKNKK